MAVHKFKKWLFERKWKAHRRKEKKKLLKKYKIELLEDLEGFKDHVEKNLKDYKSELDKDPNFIKKAKLECIKAEEKFILLEQIEQTRSMVNFEDSINELYLSIISQFGYITLFAPFYPLSVLFISASNILVIFFTARAYSKFIKRPLSRQMGSIGIWNYVMKGISFVSTLYNCFLVLYPAGGLKKIFGTENWKRDVIIILIVSHALIIMKFILERSIPELPDWVQTRIKKERNREFLKINQNKNYLFQKEQENLYDDSGNEGSGEKNINRSGNSDSRDIIQENESMFKKPAVRRKTEKETMIFKNYRKFGLSEIPSEGEEEKNMGDISEDSKFKEDTNIKKQMNFEVKIKTLNFGSLKKEDN